MRGFPTVALSPELQAERDALAESFDNSARRGRTRTRQYDHSSVAPPNLEQQMPTDDQIAPQRKLRQLQSGLNELGTFNAPSESVMGHFTGSLAQGTFSQVPECDRWEEGPVQQRGPPLEATLAPAPGEHKARPTVKLKPIALPKPPPPAGGPPAGAKMARPPLAPLGESLAKAESSEDLEDDSESEDGGNRWGHWGRTHHSPTPRPSSDWRDKEKAAPKARSGIWADYVNGGPGKGTARNPTARSFTAPPKDDPYWDGALFPGRKLLDPVENPRVDNRRIEGQRRSQKTDGPRWEVRILKTGEDMSGFKIMVGEFTPANTWEQVLTWLWWGLQALGDDSRRRTFDSIKDVHMSCGSQSGMYQCIITVGEEKEDDQYARKVMEACMSWRVEQPVELGDDRGAGYGFMWRTCKWCESR